MLTFPKILDKYLQRQKINHFNIGYFDIKSPDF